MTIEKNRGRLEIRVTKVYKAPSNLAKGWESVNTVIKVYRKTYRKKNGKQCVEIETAYFISSLPCQEKAKVFHEGIRGHWSIENSLHYTKDVILMKG